MIKEIRLICLSVIVLILWRTTTTHAQFEPLYGTAEQAQFDSFNSIFGWVLQGHVIKTFSNVAGVGRCIMECSLNDVCYSLNYYPSVGVCELNSATHSSHPGDYVPSNNGSFLLYIFRRATVCVDSLCTSGERCFLKPDGITRQCKDCSSALGMEDRTIPDSAIVSSSTYGLGSSGVGGRHARLNNVASAVHGCCWAPGYLRAGEFLQVDLGKLKVVTRIATQGRDGNQIKYITKYTITWSKEAHAWQDYTENNMVKVFNGNYDQLSVVTNTFKEKLLTRYIRLVVQEWYGYIELRMELYGCSL